MQNETYQIAHDFNFFTCMNHFKSKIINIFRMCS